MSPFPTTDATEPVGRGTREQILDAALRVIAASGVDGIKHRRVAREAGVSLGSISYHFASREALIGAAFHHFMDRGARLIDDVRGGGSAADADAVVDFLAALVDRQLDDPSTLLVEYELMLYAARDAEHAEGWRRWNRALTARLAEALEPLGVGRPFVAARTLVELLRGHEVTSLAEARRPDDLRPRLRRVLRAFMDDEEV